MFVSEGFNKAGFWLPKTGDDGRLPEEQNLVVGELTPGETITKSWTVWGDPRYVSHIENGTVQFENSIGLDSANSDSGNQVSWTLTITIGSPK